MAVARRKSEPAPLEAPKSGVFEREASAWRTLLAAIGQAELGDVMTGLEANMTWLESVFTTEHPREDIIDALRDLRVTQERLLWFYREAVVLSGDDSFEDQRLAIEFTLLVETAIHNLREKSGIAPPIEVTAIPAAILHVNADLVVRMLERLLTTALQFTDGDSSAQVRGFLEGSALHMVVTASTTAGHSTPELGEAASTGDMSSSLRFCDGVARRHGGRLTVHCTEVGVALHVSLPRHVCADPIAERE